MTTSELPDGTLIKFKNAARLGLFYERHTGDWSNPPYGSLKTIDVQPGDIVAIIKTVVKDDHIGQTIFWNGMTKIIYYRTATFFDENRASLGPVDLTLENYYYDVLES